MQLSKDCGAEVFERYSAIILEDADGDKQNLYYTSSTRDIWSRVNKERAKNRSMGEIIRKLASIKEGYIERGRLK